MRKNSDDAVHRDRVRIEDLLEGGWMMIRGILGTIVGVVAGTVVIMLLEMLGHAVYPFPAGLDPKDHAALTKFMMNAPIGAWCFVLAAYAAGSFTGGAVGTLIGRKAWIGWVIGGLFMILGLIG